MSRLLISERKSGDGYALDLKGDITFGAGNIELRRSIRRLLAEGKNNIYLNFSEVGYIDSSGIGELISALMAVTRDGGQLKLLNPTSRIKELLGIAKLLSVFEISEEAEAVHGRK